MSLFDTKTNKVCCVINFESEQQQEQIISCLSNFSTLGLTYYAILHDNDFDNNGVRKTPHIHLVLQRSLRSLVKWYFKRIVAYLYVNENQVSIMPCDNLFASVQYLIHKNDSDKTQYLPSDIYTNVSCNELGSILSQDLTHIELTFEYLKDLCIQTSCNKLQIMSIIGIGRYNAFRNSINDFIEQFKKEYIQDITRDSMIDNLP